MSTTCSRSFHSSLWRQKSSKASSSTLQRLDNSYLTPTKHDIESPDSRNTKGILFAAISQAVPAASEISIVLDRCKDEIITRGLFVEGIFRRSGSAAMTEKLMNEFRMADDPRLIDLSSVSIHTVAGIFKRFLQQLSEPVIPKSFQPELLNAYESTQNIYEKKNRIMGACRALPQEHCELLSFVLHMAHTISRHSDQNKMSAENLAIIFAPTCIRLDGLGYLLPTSNNNNNNNNKSSLSSLHGKIKLLRTVSLRLSPSRSSKIPSAMSSFTSLPYKQQGLGSFCRSMLSRTKKPIRSEEGKTQISCLVPRYEPDKLMELELVKDYTRWNHLFEFMINHPPLPKFDDPNKLPLSPMVTTTTAEPEAVLSQVTSPATVYNDTVEDSENGMRVMMEVMDETLAALSDETAEFFESIRENNMTSRYRPSDAVALDMANDEKNSDTEYATVWAQWQEIETQPMPQIWKRNSITHHHSQKHGNDLLKSLSQNVDFIAPSKKRPLSISFIPGTSSRLSAFLR